MFEMEKFILSLCLNFICNSEENCLSQKIITIANTKQTVLTRLKVGVTRRFHACKISRETKKSKHLPLEKCNTIHEAKHNYEFKYVKHK